MAEEWTEYDGGAVQEWHRSASRIRVASAAAVIPQSAFEDCDDLRAVDLSNVATISNFAFAGCRSLEQISWTSAPAVEIGEGAFYLCEALTRVIIPSSVATIKASAFEGCRGLVEVNLSEGIRRIGSEAFASCSTLLRINIPTSVNAIEAMAFSGCDSLEEVELNEGLQCIGDSAFSHCTSLLRINIPSTTLKIGGGAFAGCDQLRSAELQEGLRTIGTWAFRKCRSLGCITIPSSVTLVDKSAFEECTQLSMVTLLEGVHCIAGDAFYDCHTLARINIPPVAFVIDIGRSNCHFMRTGKLHSLMRTTMPRNLVGRKLIVSKWLQYRSPSQLAQARGKVNEILGRRQTEGQKIALIREWFAYYDRLDVTTMIELAIWKVNMVGNERDAEARQARRQNCGGGMTVIIPAVLPFLEG